MTGKDFYFFITREEAQQILEYVFEKDNNLHAALSGMYDSINENLFWEDIRQLPLDLPLFRRSDNRFVIQRKGNPFGIQEILQKRGGIKIDVDFGSYDVYTYISFGGYVADKKILLAGELLTSVANPETKYLFELFQKPIKKLCSYKFDRFFVSDAAMEMHLKGIRLCDSTTLQDPDYDNEPILIKGSNKK